jgi:hypothetical protein
MAAVWSLLTNLYRPIHLPKCFLDAYAFISVSTAQKPTTYFSTPHIAGTSVGEILELQVKSFYVFCCSMFIWGAGGPKQYPLCRLLIAFTWMLACAVASQKEIILTEVYCKLNEDTLDFFFVLQLLSASQCYDYVFALFLEM